MIVYNFFYYPMKKLLQNKEEYLKLKQINFLILLDICADGKYITETGYDFRKFINFNIQLL